VKDTLITTFLIFIALVSVIASGTVVVAAFIAALVADNFRWILICGTFLTIAWWYL
jgi:hypothetical protein